MRSVDYSFAYDVFIRWIKHSFPWPRFSEPGSCGSESRHPRTEFGGYTVIAATKYYLIALICAAGFSLNLEAADIVLEAGSDVTPAACSVLRPLNAAALDADWQALIESIHALERVAAPFVEERTFAFRKKPKQYRGVFRKEADGRVSLAYTEPEAIALHMGDDFAYYRKGEGTIRRIPQSNSQGAAMALFPKLLNFDLVAISEFYAISGSLDGDGWQLIFAAKAEVEVPYHRMRITGLRTAVKRIELSKNTEQQIVIEMGDPVYPEFYLPQIKAEYFFRPELK